jgi:ribonuclease-3
MNRDDLEEPLEPGLPAARQAKLEALSRRLGHRFKDLGLLDQALRHSSYAHENPEVGPSNEKLEFLGDAVLDLAVSNLLLAHFPQSSEGELSRRRAALVNARHLASLGRELELGSHLLLGRGEELQAGRGKPSLLADALEAVLAAVFLDGGLKAAQKIIRRWFSPMLLADLSWQDHKTALQELSQSRYRLSPSYHLVEESGPSHSRHFRIEVRLADKPLAQGEGHTKKQAAQTAARRALEALRREEEGGGGS